MRKTISSLLNYLACIGMALFVTFVIEGTIGMVLTYALASALIVSLVMTLAVWRRIRVLPALTRSAVSKGDSLVCEVKLVNGLFLPTPLLEVEIEGSAHFSLEGDSALQGAVSGKGSNILSFPLEARHFGKAHVFVKRIRLTDYLGIFSFKLKAENLDLTVAIYPDIPETSMQTHLLKTASLFSEKDEDEEDSSETSAVPTGLPGYDHRDYMPGDPIKRINWKLSSKRDILMVRLDEMIHGSGRTFLLDCPLTEETETALAVRDNVIESALALLQTLLADGRNASFYYYKQGMWMSVQIHSLQDIYALQEELSDFEPAEASPLIPPELAASSQTLICFTSAIAGNMVSAELIASLHPDIMLIASSRASLPVITPNQWVVSESFELSKG